VKNIFFILLSIGFFSCNKNVVYSEYKSIPEDKGWEVNNKISFETNLVDTISKHNMYVNIRHASVYEYRNLFLYLHTKYPNGKLKTDTFECILADEKGNWLGSGAGDLWDHEVLIKRNTKFPISGKYTFTFEQAMRYGDQPLIDPLPLILDIGLTIEKIDKKQ
jgi:gliding motility-associated lipoprotein GldH